MGNLKVTRKVLPEKHGAIKESNKYGNKLLSVRYLRDDEGRYVKTAEIAIYDYQRKD